MMELLPRLIIISRSEGLHSHMRLGCSAYLMKFGQQCQHSICFCYSKWSISTEEMKENSFNNFQDVKLASIDAAKHSRAFTWYLKQTSCHLIRQTYIPILKSGTIREKNANTTNQDHRSVCSTPQILSQLYLLRPCSLFHMWFYLCIGRKLHNTQLLSLQNVQMQPTGKYYMRYCAWN